MLRRYPDDFPARIAHRFDNHIPVFSLPGFLIISVPIGAGRLGIFLLQPGVDQLHLGMINQFPVPAHQIQIALVPQRGIVQHILEAGIAHIDQQNSLGSGCPLCDLYGPGQGNDPAVLIFAVIKNILHMGHGKMQVFRMLQGILKPLLSGYVHIVLKAGGRHRQKQLPISGKQSNIRDGILVIIIKKGDLAVYRLTLSEQIHIFDHTIIQGIRQLHDRAQISVQG